MAPYVNFELGWGLGNAAFAEGVRSERWPLDLRHQNFAKRRYVRCGSAIWNCLPPGICTVDSYPVADAL